MAVADEALAESDPELEFVPGPGLALTGRLGTSDHDGDLEEPLPNAELLVAQAVALAGDDHTTAALVDRFWRFAPDEELVGYTPEEMIGRSIRRMDLRRVGSLLGLCGEECWRHGDCSDPGA